MHKVCCELPYDTWTDNDACMLSSRGDKAQASMRPAPDEQQRRLQQRRQKKRRREEEKRQPRVMQGIFPTDLICLKTNHARKKKNKWIINILMLELSNGTKRTMPTVNYLFLQVCQQYKISRCNPGIYYIPHLLATLNFAWALRSPIPSVMSIAWGSVGHGKSSYSTHREYMWPSLAWAPIHFLIALSCCYIF